MDMTFTPTRSRRSGSVLLGLVLPLALASLVDILAIRLGEPTWLTAVCAVILLAGFAFSPVLVFRGLRSAPDSSAFHLSTAGALVGTLVLTACWVAAALILFVNVHLIFGGSH
jgi:hypothetical protein